MKDVPLEERRQILLELQTEKSKPVRERHDITANVLTHIRFFHGNSSAKARGYYYKDLLAGVEHPLMAQLRVLKAEGKNSQQAAEVSGVPLEKVNAMWGKIEIKK